MKRIIIFDGNNLYERGTFADLGDMKNGRGEPIGSTLYTLNSLRRTVETIGGGDRIIFAWDTKRNPYRVSIYPDYKGNRKSNPKRDAGRAQLPQFKELLGYLGIINLKHEELEADDIIAWLVHSWPSTDKITVVSNDGDFHQMLIGKPNVEIYSKDHYVTETNFLEETGITTNQFLAWSAIQGCTTDHIKGVQGIGGKTAAKILQACPTEELLFAKLAEITAKQRMKNPETPDYIEVYQRNLLLMRLDLWNRDVIPTQVWKKIEADALASKPPIDRLAFHKLIYDIGIPSIGKKMPAWADIFEKQDVQGTLL